MTLHAFKNFATSSSSGNAAPVNLSALTKDQLFEELLASEQKAILALRDPEISGKLTLDEMFDVLGAHKVLAYNVISSDWCYILSGDNLARLGQTHFHIARSILQNDRLWHKLDPFDLSKLGEKSCDIAEAICEKRVEISEYHTSREVRDVFVDFAKKHSTIAERVYIGLLQDFHRALSEAEKNPEWYERYIWDRCKEIASLGAASVIVAERIMKNEALRDRLSGRDLVTLGQNHYFVARAILNNETLRSKLGWGALAELGQIRFTMLFIIETFRSKLNIEEWVSLGIKHLDVARKIIKDDTLQSQLKGRHWILLGSEHPEIAQYFIQNKALHDKLEESDLNCNLLHWVGIAEKDAENARAILDDEGLCEKLDGKNLALLGRNHPAIALRILRNKKFSDKLESGHLPSLGRKYFEIAREIFDTPAHRGKMNGYDLAHLASHHPGLTREILRDKTLYDKMSGYRLEIMGKCHIDKCVDDCLLGNALYILQGDTDSKLSVEIREKYQKLVSIWEGLQKCMPSVEPPALAAESGTTSKRKP